MFKLLSAGFRRMWRSKLLYLGMLAMALNTLSVLINNLYYKRLWDLPMGGENLFFGDISIIGIVIAVFVGFFVGAEHEGGVFRNKVVSGADKWEIYFAELVVTTVAALLMQTVGSGLVIAVGLPLLGGVRDFFGLFLPQIFCCFLSVVSLNALLLLVAMLIPSKAVGTVTAILLSLVLIYLLPQMLYNKLSEPPMIDGGGYADNFGEYHEFPDRTNPDYVSGFSRTVLQLCYDALPTGQIDQYSGEKLPENIARFPFYSLLVITAASVSGAICFRRRDMK